MQVADAVEDALREAARQHVAKALHADVLLAWAVMVEDGWCSDATKKPQDDHDTTELLRAYFQA